MVGFRKFNSTTMKIIHVHLIGQRKDYYFSSITAVFDVMTPDDIGVTLDYLLHAGLPQGAVVCNRRAIIKQGKVIIHKRKRHAIMMPKNTFAD